MSLRRCQVCQYVRHERYGVMCSVCVKAMDRANLVGDDAHLIEWAAKRAIRFERRRARELRTRGIPDRARP